MEQFLESFIQATFNSALKKKIDKIFQKGIELINFGLKERAVSLGEPQNRLINETPFRLDFKENKQDSYENIKAWNDFYTSFELNQAGIAGGLRVIKKINKMNNHLDSLNQSIEVQDKESLWLVLLCVKDLMLSFSEIQIGQSFFMTYYQKEGEKDSQWLLEILRLLQRIITQVLKEQIHEQRIQFKDFIADVLGNLAGKLIGKSVNDFELLIKAEKIAILKLVLSCSDEKENIAKANLMQIYQNKFDQNQKKIDFFKAERWKRSIKNKSIVKHYYTNLLSEVVDINRADLADMINKCLIQIS